MALSNAQIRLAARPTGMPTPECWELREAAVPEISGGEFLVAVEYLSLDPAMRSWMNAGRSYIPPVEIGEVFRAFGIGRVIASNHPDHPVGAHLAGVWGAQRYAVSNGDGTTPVDLALAPGPVHLGVLGISGLTAYFGLFDVGRPEPGETVVVSGAAGSVGSVAGQLARIHGCRVVGIAGGADKCAWLTEELGFDAAIDYKADDLGAALREHANKVDVYFDNVGGDTLDAVLVRLNQGARVVISGAISQYNADGKMRGPANYMQLLVARASMTGFVVFDYAARYREGVEKLAGWLQSGELISREDVVRGDIAEFPDVLMRLFRGENTGKLVLELDPAG